MYVYKCVINKLFVLFIFYMCRMYYYMYALLNCVQFLHIGFLYLLSPISSMYVCEVVHGVGEIPILQEYI